MGGKDLCLLSLDGGGVRGLSSLLILKKLMESVSKDPDNPPKPCDCFHMIGGTSTGGLIAIMLGRLQMTVDECIKVYKELAPAIFTKLHSLKYGVRFQGMPNIFIKDRFNHEALEKGIRDLLKKKGYDTEELFKEAPVNSKCLNFVCATSGQTSDTVVFSSYYSPRRGNDLRSIAKIWQVARATSAASSFFEGIQIGNAVFKDGGTGANNPIQQLWNEATDFYGDQDPNWRLEDNLKCLVSIGTGTPLLSAFGDSLKDIGKALIAVATNSEQVAHLFQQQHTQLFREPGRLAFRFNVVQGLEQVGLEEKEKVPVIEEATRRYISTEDVFVSLQACAAVMRSNDFPSFWELLVHPSSSSHTWTLEDTKEQTSEEMKSLSYLPHTEAFTLWVTAGGTLFYQKPSLRMTGPSQEDIIARVLGHSVESCSANDHIESRVLYFRSRLPEILRSGKVSSPVMKYNPGSLVNAVDVIIELTKQLLRALNFPFRHSDTTIGSLRSDEQFCLSKFPLLFRSRSYEQLLPAFLDLLGRTKDPIIIAIDNLEGIEGQIHSLIMELARLTRAESTARIRLILSSTPSDFLKGDFQVYLAQNSTEYSECVECLWFERQRTRRDEIAHAEEGTTEWIWDHPSYLAWKKELSGILWIQGKPGSGKSVLAKSILEQQHAASPTSSANRLNNDGRYLICDWFYSTRSGQTLMSHKSLMQSLLYQLLQQNPSLFRHFKAVYRQSPPCSSDWITLANLKGILKSIAEDEVKAICVVDAMDESEDNAESEQQRRLVLRYFSSLVSEVPKSRMKFLILSRPYPDIECHFLEHRWDYENIHHVILERENGPAIAKIVDSGIRSLQQAMHPLARPKGNLPGQQQNYPGPSRESRTIPRRRQLQKRVKGEEEELCARIRDYLLSNANGVILWVTLILATLKTMVEGVYTLKGLQEALASLPTNLTALYRHILNELIANHDETQLYLARKALMWVSGANEITTLTIAELHEALAVPDEIKDALLEEEDPVRDEKIHCNDWNEFRYRLRILCGPLIEVIRSPDRVIEDDLDEDEVDNSDLVQLLHRTVKDILAKPSEAYALSFQDGDAQTLVEKALKSYGSLVLSSPYSPLHPFRIPKELAQQDYDIFDASEIMDYLDQRTLMPFALRAFPRWPFDRTRTDLNNFEYLATILVDEVVFPKSNTSSNLSELLAEPNLILGRPTARRLGMIAICTEYTLYSCDNGLVTAMKILLQLFSVQWSDREVDFDFFAEIIHVLLALAKKYGLMSLVEKLKLMAQFEPTSYPPTVNSLPLGRIRMHIDKCLGSEMARGVDDPPPLVEIEETISRVTDFVKQRTPIFVRMKALLDSSGPFVGSIWGDMAARIVRLQHGSSGTSPKTVKVDVWDAVLIAMAQHRKKGSRAGKLTARALEVILERNVKMREIEITLPDMWPTPRSKKDKKKKKGKKAPFPIEET